MDGVLEQFHVLADEYLEYALRGEMHGFSNVSDTIAELYQGVNKSHPCGAALGLMGVGPSGDIAPCHRFVDSDTPLAGQYLDRRGPGKAGGFPEPRPHQQQVRLPHLLGAAAVRRRLPSRSFCALRRHRPSQSALLRLDSRLDRHCVCGFTARSAPQNPDFLEKFAERKASMKHLRADQQKGPPHRRSGRRDHARTWSHCRISNAARSARMSPWDARWRFRPAGRWIRRAARPDFASRWSAISTIAT